MPTLRLLRTCRTSTSLGFTSFISPAVEDFVPQSPKYYPTGKRSRRAAAPGNCRRFGWGLRRTAR